VSQEKFKSNLEVYIFAAILAETKLHLGGI